MIKLVWPMSAVIKTDGAGTMTMTIEYYKVSLNRFTVTFDFTTNDQGTTGWRTVP